MTELSETNIRALLAFERRWWRYAGEKEQAIAEDLELSPVRYYQLLAQALHTELALSIDPVTVGRLTRVMSRKSVTSVVLST